MVLCRQVIEILDVQNHTYSCVHPLWLQWSLWFSASRALQVDKPHSLRHPEEKTSQEIIIWTGNGTRIGGWRRRRVPPVLQLAGQRSFGIAIQSLANPALVFVGHVLLPLTWQTEREIHRLSHFESLWNKTARLNNYFVDDLHVLPTGQRLIVTPGHF